MKKLGLVAAVLMLSLGLAVGIAAAAGMPGGSEAGMSDMAAAGRQRLTITDASIFSRFGFCDDVDSAPAY